MRNVFACSAFLLLLPLLVSAQEGGQKVEVFGGYSFATSEFSFYGGQSNGWNASLNLKAKPWVGFVSDFAGYYKTISYSCQCPSDHSTTYTFLFGPQVSTTFSRVTPFAHVLAGLGHIYTTQNVVQHDPIKKHNSFAFAFGGGLDVHLVHNLAWRVQGDYLHTAFETFDNQLMSTRSNGRISTGLVVSF